MVYGKGGLHRHLTCFRAYSILLPSSRCYIPEAHESGKYLRPVQQHKSGVPGTVHYIQQLGIPLMEISQIAGTVVQIRSVPNEIICYRSKQTPNTLKVCITVSSTCQRKSLKPSSQILKFSRQQSSNLSFVPEGPCSPKRRRACKTPTSPFRRFSQRPKT